MTDCPFQLENGYWTCPTCGWVYKRKSDKPPRRNRPATITDADRKRMAEMGRANGLPPDLLQQTVEHLTAELESKKEKLSGFCTGNVCEVGRKKVTTEIEQLEKRLEQAKQSIVEAQRQQAEAIAAAKELEYSKADINYIVDVICPPCDNHKNGRCKCGGCKQSQGRPIREMAERGGWCPMGKW